jgi:DivIVA domain-containing protein
MFRPDDVTSHDLSVVLRGYDRDQVDGFLQRLSEAYLLTWRQGAALRERLRLVEEELEAAQGEGQASAKAVAELIQRCTTAEDQLAQARVVSAEVSGKLDVAVRERAQALADLRQVTERSSDLEKRLEELGKAPRLPESGEQLAVAEGEAAAVLVAAARAAEDVRQASRERALRTLSKARERAHRLEAEAERERVVLVEMQERRERAEQEANEILARAGAEADRVVSAVGEERQRLRELLSEALASLQAQTSNPQPGHGDSNGPA